VGWGVRGARLAVEDVGEPLPTLNLFYAELRILNNVTQRCCLMRSWLVNLYCWYLLGLEHEGGGRQTIFTGQLFPPKTFFVKIA
jgi:hypothetical protein